MKKENLTLEGVVNIAKAEGLFHEMEALVLEAGCTIIQASEVTRVDTAILQLLTSFIADMANVNINVEWAGVSDEFTESAKLLGLEQALNL